MTMLQRNGFWRKCTTQLNLEKELRALTPLNVSTSIKIWPFNYMMGSPNVLIYAEFCRIITVLPLTPVKTVPMEELCIEVVSSFFTSCCFPLPLDWREWMWSCFSSSSNCSIHGRERFFPWRGRVSCPCILTPFWVKEEVYLKILNTDLDKICVVCTYSSIEVCYILVSSMVHSRHVRDVWVHQYIKL